MATRIQVEELIIPEQLGPCDFTGAPSGRMRVRPEVGSGERETIVCGDHMSVVIEHGRASADLWFNYPISEPHFMLVFQTDGRHDTDIGAGRPMTMLGCSFHASHLTEYQAVQLFRDTPTSAISINVRPSFLQHYLDDNAVLPVDFLDRSLTSPDHPRTLQTGTYDHAIAVALNQLVTSSPHGGLRRLYIAAKAMEILSLVLGRMAEADTRDRKGSLLKRSDVERVHLAREILASSLESPTTIAELADRCGLNATTLKRGFREVFGTTIFGVLRRMRMEAARPLIVEQGQTVLEAALAVGYANPSHFARAFRREMGVAPSRLKR